MMDPPVSAFFDSPHHPLSLLTFGTQITVAGTFLMAMRERLRLGAKEIVARIAYQDQQKALRTTIEVDTKGFGEAAKKRYVDNVNRPFPSRAKVISVLDVLKQMVEGHNSMMQDYFRVQPNEATNVDLVLEIYRLFESLTRNLHPSNADQLFACLSTLSELVQGNGSGGTAATLLGTKL